MEKSAVKAYPQPSLWRKAILILATVIGTICLCGAVLFAFAGAGMYGSPFAKPGLYNTTLFLILLFGPVAILPCTAIEKWVPGVGGLLLCASAILTSIALIFNNQCQWGFAIHSAGICTASLALPIFVLGSLMWRSYSTDLAWVRATWWLLVFAMSGLLAFYAWNLRDDILIVIQQLFMQ